MLHIILLFIINAFLIEVAKSKTQCGILRDLLIELTGNQYDFQEFNNDNTMDCCNLQFVGCYGTSDKKISNIEFDGSILSINQQMSEKLLELTDIERIGFTNINNKNFALPTFLNQLPKLTVLEVYDNQLTNILPDTIFQISNLKTLAFINTNIGGHLPDNFGTLSNLEQLYIQNNMFNGQLPESIGDLKNLKEIYINNDLFDGTIPSSFGKLVNARIIDLRGNFFTGEIPENIGNLVNLETLNLSSNKLQGAIPESIENLKYLKSLDLSSNSFSGTADFAIYLTSLKEINLSKSGLFGVIPNFSSTVTSCSYDTNNFCTEIKPNCGQFEAQCTPELYQKVEIFKENQKKLKESKKETPKSIKSENDDDNSKTKYIISLLIIMIPLLGIAIFLRWYKSYSNKKEDDLIVKHIDMINTKNQYYNSDFKDFKDINSDTGSDAYMLLSRTPDHRKLSNNTQSLPRSIFDDSDVNEDTMDHIEREMINRIIEEDINNNLHSRNFNTPPITTAPSKHIQFKINTTSPSNINFDNISPIFSQHSSSHLFDV